MASVRRPTKIKAYFHSDLDRRSSPELGWHAIHLSGIDRTRSKNIRCLEIRVDGPVEARSAEHIQNEIAWHFCTNELGQPYLVTLSDIRPTSRVRSYKGAFDHAGVIKQGSFAEEEIEISPKWSIVSGIAAITKENKDECFAVARSFTRSFILLTSQADEFDERTLLRSLVRFRFKGKATQIDYLKLVPDLCWHGFAVLSFGWDQAGDYANLKLFFNSSAQLQVQREAGEVEEKFGYV